jgi:8-oxo-dGTP diphosphatase
VIASIGAVSIGGMSIAIMNIVAGDIVVTDVVGAVIIREGLILCAQRGAGGSLAGLWEFPGGKVEPGESHHRALTREITEELGCHITVADFIMTTMAPTDTATIALHTYVCRIVSGEPTAREHAQLAWVAPGDLMSLDWSRADIPTVDHIVNGDFTT